MIELGTFLIFFKQTNNKFVAIDRMGKVSAHQEEI